MPLASIEDLTGQGLDLERDHTGRLITIRQRLEKRVLRLGYYPGDLLCSATLQSPDGQIHSLVRYEYDSKGRLSAAYNALGYADRYDYNAQGLLAREIAKHGGVFSYRYDEKRRCIRYSGLDRYDEKRLRFLDAAGITEVTDSYGATSRYQYLPSGQIITEWNPMGAETRTEYDQHGRIIAKTRPNGAATRYTYDEGGNRCQIVNALGQVWQLTFNSQHQLIAFKGPNDQTWLRKYDGQHRLVCTVDALGFRWVLRYDSEGNFVALTNPKGATRHFCYVAGVLTASSDWLGNFTRLKYDAMGRLTARTDPMGHTYEYSYDSGGNLIQVLLPDGAKFHAVYDEGGNLTAQTDASGHMISLRYGSCHRLLETKDANGHSVRYCWGTEPRRLECVLNEKGETCRFVYNLTGHCAQVIGFDGRRLQFAYDLTDMCIGMTNGAGETIEIERDPLGCIVGQKLPNGLTARFTYDPLGNLIAAVNDDCAVYLERDAIGRLVREVQQTKGGKHWVKYTLDAMGETTGLETDLGLRVNCELNGNGMWDRLSTSYGHSVQFQHDARGKEVRRTWSGGFGLDQRYDPVGRLVEQRVIYHGSQPFHLDAANWGNSIADALIQRSYTRGGSGFVTSIDDRLAGTTHYACDPSQRLLEVLRDRAPSERFEYDATGNVTRGITFDGKACVEDEIFSYGSGNRLLSKGGTRYEHDMQGRLVRKIEEADSAHPKVWKYEWDALDQLRRVIRPDGQVWQYSYDALARRVRKIGPSVAVNFVWSCHVPIHEISTSEEHWTGWIFQKRSFVPLAIVKDRQTRFVISDHLGSPREIVDRSGRVVARHLENAFGAPSNLEPSENACPFRFQGQYCDSETGLHYNRHRYYDPDSARYISSDPAGLSAGINQFAYTANPIAWIDPYGLGKVCEKTLQTAIDHAVDNIPGLTREQAEVILRGAFSRDSSAVFGGSRVRGNFGPGSDLDVGFGSLSASQASKVIDKASQVPGGLPMEQTRIVPGNTPPNIPTITSPEDFFMQSGVRAGGDPKAGQAYGPSGYISYGPDGSITRATPDGQVTKVQ
jgi:RHS repeat-associated protein